MRIPFFSFLISSPFDGLKEHAEKVKECAWVFQQALECYASEKCNLFEEYRQEVGSLESQADEIKRRILGHIPMGTRMPVSSFQLFMYLKEQDKVLNSVEEALDWLSYRVDCPMPEALKKDFLLLVDTVVEPIEELSRLVDEAKIYFDNYSDRQRGIIKNVISNLRKKEQEADRIEYRLKQAVFSMEQEQVSVFHMVRLIEVIGSIADHAENAGNMMRAMIARKRGFWRRG